MAYLWEWEQAEKSIARALELATDNADVLTAATRLSFCLPRLADAEKFGRRAVAADPLNPVAYRMFCQALFSAGKLDEAVEMMRQSLDISPDFIASRHTLALILSAAGRHQEALAKAMLEKSERARLTAISTIKWALGSDAYKAESDKALAALVAHHGSHSAAQISHLYAMRGGCPL